MPVLPTVATTALLVLHVPLGVMSAKVILLFTHTVDGPVIAAGDALMVIVTNVAQPVRGAK
jgi:hypothetical protein